MSMFAPDRNYHLSGSDSIRGILNLWSQAMPNVSSRQVENGSFYLHISENGLQTAIKVTQAVVVHEFMSTYKVTSDHKMISLKRYDLVVSGVDVRQRGFLLKACAIIEASGSLSDVVGTVQPSLFWNEIGSRPRSDSH